MARHQKRSGGLGVLFAPPSPLASRWVAQKWCSLARHPPNWGEPPDLPLAFEEVPGTVRYPTGETQLMTLEEARNKAQIRSRNGGTWMVIQKGDAYEAKPYAESEQKIAVFFGGKERISDQ